MKERMMEYCPCCGKIVRGEFNDRHPNCDICNTPYKIVPNYTVDEHHKLTLNNEPEADKKIKQIIETLVKTSPEFNQEMYDFREANRYNDGYIVGSTAKCPTCGSTSLTKISGANKVGSAALFGVFSLGHISKTFKCNSCGYKW